MAGWLLGMFEIGIERVEGCDGADFDCSGDLSKQRVKEEYQRGYKVLLDF